MPVHGIEKRSFFKFVLFFLTCQSMFAIFLPVWYGGGVGLRSVQCARMLTFQIFFRRRRDSFHSVF